MGLDKLQKESEALAIKSRKIYAQTEKAHAEFNSLCIRFENALDQFEKELLFLEMKKLAEDGIEEWEQALIKEDMKEHVC